LCGCIQAKFVRPFHHTSPYYVPLRIHVTGYTIRKKLFKAEGHYDESETSEPRNSSPQQDGGVFLRSNYKNRSGNVQILVNLDSKKDLDKIYEKVKEKGFEILMDLQKTSWGSWFLVFEDSYGIGWQLNFPEAE
jgi:uncharacterized glyoxalase superfamily protein PhnB